MRLDLGGIGMGFAIDQGLNILKVNDIVAGMIDASGDIGVIGRPPNSAGWRVEVDALRARVRLRVVVVCRRLHASFDDGDARARVVHRRVQVVVLRRRVHAALDGDDARAVVLRRLGVVVGRCGVRAARYARGVEAEIGARRASKLTAGSQDRAA